MKPNLMFKQASLKDRIWYGEKFKVTGKLLCLLGFHCWQYNCNGYTLAEWEECYRDGCSAKRDIPIQSIGS